MPNPANANADLGGNSILNASTLTDSSNKLSVDVSNRQLVDTDGTTILAKWGTCFASYQTTNAQTGTTYTLALTDAGEEVTCSNAGSIAVTVPANASIAFPIGTRIMITQIAAGVVTLTADTGVTIKGFSGANGAYTYTSAVATNAKTAGQESALVIKKMATNTWRCFGAP